jgi:hypothetical protein
VIEAILKYPRTRHLLGSRLQPGDDDLEAVSIDELSGAHLVIEEKLDGANAGLSFNPEGELRLQSRGHYLTGGYRERHFDLFKSWAAARSGALWDRLGPRFVVYGEWLYAKHTVFYDLLPHYFLEFDVYDRHDARFLSTPVRHELLEGTGIASVPVLGQGPTPTLEELRALVKPSLYKSPAWRDRLADAAATAGQESARIAAETDPSDHSEGLYLKVEADGRVTDRLKFVRASFLTSVVDSGSHWIDRPIVPNQLRAGVELFG